MSKFQQVLFSWFLLKITQTKMFFYHPLKDTHKYVLHCMFDSSVIIVVLAVRGYHIYSGFWLLVVEELLVCLQNLMGAIFAIVRALTHEKLTPCEKFNVYGIMPIPVVFYFQMLSKHKYRNLLHQIKVVCKK